MMNLSFSTQHQLKDLGVASVYLFGSRAQGTSNPLSDYDFAILMNKPGDEPSASLLSPLYHALYRLFSPLCPRQYPNDIIDIVFLRRLPLELQMHIMKNGKIIFDDNPSLRANEEARIMLKRADFEPLRQMMREALLARL